MDQSEQQLNEQATAADSTEQVASAAAPPAKKAPRVRRAASSPAGAPAAAAQPAATTTAAATTAAGADTSGAEPQPEPAAEQPRRRPTRARKTAEAPAETAAGQLSEAPAAPASGDSVSDATESAAPVKAKATRTRRRAATAEAGPAAATPPATEAVTEPVAEAVAEAAAPDAPSEDADAEAAATEKPARARRSPRAPRATRAKAAEPAEEAAGPSSAPEDGKALDGAEEATDAAAGAVEEPPAEAEESSSVPAFADPFAIPESPLALLFHAPDLSTAVPAVRVTAASPEDAEDDDDDDAEDGGRRRRRSRRSRGRSRADNGQDDAGDDSSESLDSEDGTPRAPAEGADGVTSRRRRRRRRGDQDLELTGGEGDDPPNTITRVRAPRQSSEAPSDKVTSVKGSTRLEAKKQRRRESRDTGRRRQVITEAEFLARRESVDRQMVVRQRDDRIQIGVLEDGILAEHFVSNTQQDSLIGNVYLGKVQNVLPSMEAAFIDIGRGRNAVLYAGEVNWDAAGLDGQPRRIELALKSGDSVLVQVTKDPVGHKGARLTSQISLPGRYLVYVPGGSMTGISRKLPDVERNRLKRILKDRLPENAGVIVRTAAEGASEEELTHDINRLRAQWEEIERKSSSTKTLAPELLYGEPDLTIKVVRDVFNEDFSKLVVSGEEAWDTIEAYVMYVAPDLVGRLEKWTSSDDIFTASRIDEQIQKALDRKVYLPSGGSLVIDRTEAMTVVDVNTGKFTGSGGNLEETVTKNNLEAAEEVVRQLRLRDIGGIIVIDFIDMVLEANRDLVLRRLVECLGRDRTKHQVAEVTSLGLVQMTRKRMGTGLLEVFGETCEHCAGRGVVTQDEPVEHRRHAVSTENHQQHLRQEKMSRSERKRSRGRGSEQAEEQQAQPVAEARVDSPERAAKAEAARAALASIAAATHAAHEGHEDEAAPENTVEVSGAVLTINGETVTLPRAEVSVTADAERPKLTLDSLAEAFDRKPGDAPEAGTRRTRSSRRASAARVEVTGTTEAQTADAGPADEGAARSAETDVTGTDAGTDAGTGQRTIRPAASEQPAQQPRRKARRRAGSAQGTALSAAIETVADSPQGEGRQNGQQHVARAGGPVQRPAADEAEPMILGVGIPASEL